MLNVTNINKGNTSRLKLEKDMATPSGILVWRISWTEEPGSLESMVSQRAGHN